MINARLLVELRYNSTNKISQNYTFFAYPMSARSLLEARGSKRSLAMILCAWKQKISSTHTTHSSFFLTFQNRELFLWSVWKNWKSFLGWVKCNRLVMTQDPCRGLPRAELQMKAHSQQCSHVDLGSKRDNGLFPLIWSNIMQTSNLR